MGHFGRIDVDEAFAKNNLRTIINVYKLCTMEVLFAFVWRTFNALFLDSLG